MHQDVRNVRRDCLVKRVFRLSNDDSSARVALWVGSRRRGSKMTCGKSVKIHCDGSTASGKVLSLRGGEVAEWFKAHAWKACVANPYRGSNPSLSARFIFEKSSTGVGFFHCSPCGLEDPHFLVLGFSVLPIFGSRFSVLQRPPSNLIPWGSVLIRQMLAVPVSP